MTPVPRRPYYPLNLTPLEIEALISLKRKATVLLNRSESASSLDSGDAVAYLEEAKNLLTIITWRA